MDQKIETLDARGLIRESYRMDGIGAAECRSIFLDWALGLPDGTDPEEARAGVLAHYAPEYPDHPMTQVLREGLGQTDRPRRRGGWRARDRG